MTPNTVQQYIYNNSIPQSRQKAQTLFSNGRVQSFKIDHDKRQIVSIVWGDTDVYSVKIQFSDKSITGTSCNCKYNFGGICKHTVASLYHLEKHLLMNPNALTTAAAASKMQIPKPKQHLTTEWYNVGNSEFFALDGLEKMYRKEYFYRIEFQTLTLVENKYSVTLKSSGLPQTVEFEQRPDGLHTRCSCNKITTHLCVHQGTVLSEIVANFEPNFLTSLKSEKLSEKRLEILKKYRLPEHINFDSFFKLDIENKALIYSPTGKAKGLIISDNQANTQTFVSRIKAKKSFIEEIAETSQDTDFHALGLCLIPLVNYYDTSESYEITPITGKLNKDGTRLVNPIRTLKDASSARVSISATQERIIRLCKQLSREEQSEYMSRMQHSGKKNDASMVLFNYCTSVYNELFPILAEQKHTFYSDSAQAYLGSSSLKAVKFSEEKISIKFKLTEDELFLNLDTILLHEDNELKFEDETTEYLHPFMIRFGDKIASIGSESDAQIILQILENDTKSISVLRDDVETLLPHLQVISELYPVETDLISYQTETETMNPLNKQIYLTESGRFIFLEPIVTYNNGQQINVLRHGVPIEFRDKTFVSKKREKDYELDFLYFMKQLHPEFASQHHERFFYLQAEDLIRNGWFFEAFEKLKTEGIEVFGFSNLKNFKYSPHKGKVTTHIKSGQDWFDVEIEITFGDMSVSLKDVQKALKKGENFVKLSDGSLGLLPEEWLKKLERYLRIGHIKSDNLKISKLHFSVIDELFEEKDYLDIAKEIHEKRKRLENFSEIKEVVLPKNLLGELRDYQKSGFNWLNFLQEFQWGGILADDMGLGKTIQILAFLLKQSAESKKANLVVVPTTLLFNWEKEVEKFAPTLKCYFHHGLGRMKEVTEFKDFNVIVTSYGIMARDIEMFRKYEFNFVILDESQAIKNPASQRFKATTLLRAKNRLTLTGTPIENNTFDLYAQMEFLNPGFLGSQAHFKENFSDPIDKNGDAERAAELQRMINPFILRRTKEQVAKELPPKVEDFIYCEMDTEQRKVYDAFRNKYRDYLLGKIDENGIENSKLYVLEGLTKLRQICDSPELLSDDENYGTDSVKIRELVKHITEKTGKHKLLIFSQFVKMLTVIRRELDERNIRYDYLDGQSTQTSRQGSVEHFQSDDNTRVFLISLKAGGVGLNLTAADYVYIVDPWWNPAVENQAIDRAYRIGQDKHVIAYRMICTETIEEKIMKLQDKKKKIAGDIISTDEGFIKNLTKSDIEELFG